MINVSTKAILESIQESEAFSDGELRICKEELTDGEIYPIYEDDYAYDSSIFNPRYL